MKRAIQKYSTNKDERMVIFTESFPLVHLTIKKQNINR